MPNCLTLVWFLSNTMIDHHNFININFSRLTSLNKIIISIASSISNAILLAMKLLAAPVVALVVLLEKIAGSLHYFHEKCCLHSCCFLSLQITGEEVNHLLAPDFWYESESQQLLIQFIDSNLIKFCILLIFLALVSLIWYFPLSTTRFPWWFWIFLLLIFKF